MGPLTEEEGGWAYRLRSWLEARGPGWAAFARYGFALVAVGLAVVVRRLLDPVLGTGFPFATAFLAIVAVTWLGGPGPGWAAVVLGGAAVDYFVLEPRGSFRLLGTYEAMGLGLYAFTGAGIALLGGQMYAERARTHRAFARVRRQAALIEQVHDAVLGWTWDGPITFWNSSAQRLYGFSPAEAVGRVSHELLRTLSPGGLTELLAALERDGVWEGQLDHTRRSGDVITVESRMVLVREGGRSYVLEANRDATQQLAQERALRQASDQLEARVNERTAALAETKRTLRDERDRFSRLIAGVPVALFSFRLKPDHTTSFPFVNDNYAQIVGFSADELAVDASRVFTRIHPDDAERVRAALRESASTLGTYECVYRVLNPSRGEVWAESHAVPATEPDGSILWMGYVADITEKRRLEQDLLQLNERFAVATRAAALGFWDYDPAAGKLRWDDQMFVLYGRSRANGRQSVTLWVESLHPEDSQRAQADLAAAIRESRAYESEFRIVRPGGEVRHLKAWADVKTDATGRVTNVFGVNADMTERAQAAEQLLLTIEAAPTGMLVSDGSGTIRLVNAEIERLFGYGRSELLGHTVELLVPSSARGHHPGWRETFSRRPETRAMGGRKDLFGVSKDGREIPIEVSLNPIQTPAGPMTLSSVVDVTERKRGLERLNALNHELEGQVRLRTTALRERETLLQEVHHRVKNNLQVISSLINMQANVIESVPARDALLDCRARIKTMALIHEKLYQSKDYSRVAFTGYVRGLAESVFSLADNASKRLALALDLDDVSLPVDQAIPCGLILNELISNALKHAFPAASSGCLRVALHRIADQIVLMVADDGIGMPERFDPEESRSMGLQIVTTLTAQLDGKLELIRNPGTTFRIAFPAGPEAANGSGPHAAHESVGAPISLGASVAGRGSPGDAVAERPGTPSG